MSDIVEKKPIYVCAHLILRKGDKICLVLRDGTRFASGYYSVISGKTEQHEPIRAAVVREAYEEVGVHVAIEDLAFHTMLYTQEADGIHVSTFFIADRWEGTLENKERHKHKKVDFYPLDNLPEKIIPYVKKALGSLYTGEPHKYYDEHGWE